MAIQCDCYLTRLVGVDKPCPHFRMHDLPRIEIRDDMTQDLKDLLEGYNDQCERCLLYTSPSPRDLSTSRMPSSA